MKRQMSPNDRHGEFAVCMRCGYTAQIARNVAFGGFLALGKDGSILCWNGRECALRYDRKRRATATDR